ncbi:MAG: matrixin family metalloprotease [Chloroflexota bacterium]
MIAPAPVLSWEWIGFTWVDESDISTYRYGCCDASYAAWGTARSDWNATNTPINFTVEPNVGEENIRLRTVNKNDVEWDGIASVTIAGGVINWVDARLNEFYTDGYVAAKRLSVTSHELGHTLGLAHENGVAVVMNGITCGFNSRWCTFGVSKPQQDDINGINAIY